MGETLHAWLDTLGSFDPSLPKPDGAAHRVGRPRRRDLTGLASPPETVATSERRVDRRCVLFVLRNGGFLVDAVRKLSARAHNAAGIRPEADEPDARFAEGVDQALSLPTLFARRCVEPCDGLMARFEAGPLDRFAGERKACGIGVRSSVAKS